MQFSKRNYGECSTKEFKILACQKPSEKDPQPQLFETTIFAENSVVAKSKFSKLLKNQFKLKATNTVIAKIEEIKQDNDYVMKTYGIKFVYRTRTGLCNGYKEIRHINRTLAVHDLYIEFGSKHKIQKHGFHIVEIKQLSDDEVTKSKVLPYVGAEVKFPVFFKESNTDAEVVPISTDIFN